jgi:uncharacterized protein YxjI
VTTVVASAIIFGTALVGIQVLGGALVIAAVVWVNLPGSARRRAPVAVAGTGPEGACAVARRRREREDPHRTRSPGTGPAARRLGMGLLRRHREPEGTHYRMREKMFSIGDDFWIETDDEQRAFKVNGKALRIRDTLVLESPGGEELYTIQEKKLSIRDKMEIERDGRTVATVKKALVSPLRDRFSIEVEGGPDLEAKGNVVDHEYEIERDGDRVAEVSKRWFRVRDTYGIEIAPGEDDALLLAVTVCIDQLRGVG